MEDKVQLVSCFRRRLLRATQSDDDIQSPAIRLLPPSGVESEGDGDSFTRGTSVLPSGWWGKAMSSSCVCFFLSAFSSEQSFCQSGIFWCSTLRTPSPPCWGVVGSRGGSRGIGESARAICQSSAPATTHEAQKHNSSSFSREAKNQ